ncbi:MAG TPA: RNA polymerase factor sigma-32, partial [Magnetospirillum sp.]|nr:RNA polymerase factor sigma-32 [Magnetospirillum sp.]
MRISAALPVIGEDGGLAKYLSSIRAFPVLEPEEEFMLAKRWVDYQDTGAAHKLVTSHLRLVAKIAMGYRHYGLPMADLISEGNVGLMRAVKKFDPDKGFRLSTYAMWWIKASLNEFVLNSWSLVKIGTLAAQKKLFFNLRRIKAKLNLMDAGDLPPEAVSTIATELDVAPADVVSMNRRMAGR